MNIITFLIYLSFLVVSMTIHEFSHSWVAYKLGDTTAKYSGRLTFNPIAHIDIFWTVILPILSFITTGFFVAAAKPVPINYWALKNPKRDIIWIGASGPIANFIFAAIISILSNTIAPSPASKMIIGQLIYINIILGVFNLIPIPPLDGSRIVIGLLPNDLASKYATIEPYGLIIVIFLFLTGVLDRIIWPTIKFIMFLLKVPF